MGRHDSFWCMRCSKEIEAHCPDVVQAQMLHEREHEYKDGRKADLDRRTKKVLDDAVEAMRRRAREIYTPGRDQAFDDEEDE